MFSICSGESIDIPPIKKQERSVRSNCVQTEQVQCEDKGCQNLDRRSTHVQADVSNVKKVTSVEFDPDSLAAFLNRVTPSICSALEKNSCSHAFDNYTLLSDTETTSTSKLHSLSYGVFSEEFHCAAASWNSTGTSLAVAFNSKIHDNWCEHDSAVAIWNLNRKDFNPEKPNTVIETDCCMTAVAFHPEIPAIIAGGKFNGEIMLWNIVKEDDSLMASTGSSLEMHRELITGLYWIPSSENKLKLISCSLDGKVLIWKYSERKAKLQIEDGFVVLAEHLPRSLGIKSSRLNAEVGVTSLSINHEDPSVFVIATEGGGIFQCSFNAAIIAAPNASTEDKPLKSPIVMSFDRHEGHVSCVHFSCFSRNIFLSAGSDGEFRIYSLLQQKPLLIIQLFMGILQAQWSPVRPLVIVLVSEDGKLHLWDLAVDKMNPAESLPLSTEKSPGTVVLFNKEDPQLICTGSRNSEIQIWQLGALMSSFKSNELDDFASLAAASE